MATQKIPLNKFRSDYRTLSTQRELIYGTPDNIATILVNAQATNTTAQDVTVSLWVLRGNDYFPIVYQLPVPSYDSRSLISGRVVLQGRDGDKIVNVDYLYGSASLSGVTFSLGWLETRNDD